MTIIINIYLSIYYLFYDLFIYLIKSLVSKRIMDAHDGTLSVSSGGEGLGSKFTVELNVSQFQSLLDDNRRGSLVHPDLRAINHAIKRHRPIKFENSLERLRACSIVARQYTTESINSHRISSGATSHIPNTIGDADLLSQASHFHGVNVKRKPVVLVVDDVASNRKMLSRLLMYRCEYFVDAVDGQDAVDKVREAMQRQEMFDVITIDHQMPVMDGPTATRRIREMGFTGVIIGLTGNILPRDMEIFVEAGANKVLTKPLSAKQFDETIEEYSFLINDKSPTYSLRRK